MINLLIKKKNSKPFLKIQRATISFINTALPSSLIVSAHKKHGLGPAFRSETIRSPGAVWRGARFRPANHRETIGKPQVDTRPWVKSPVTPSELNLWHLPQNGTTGFDPQPPNKRLTSGPRHGSPRTPEAASATTICHFGGLMPYPNKRKHVGLVGHSFIQNCGPKNGRPWAAMVGSSENELGMQLNGHRWLGPGT